MLPPVLHAEKGFTLIEFVVAVFIMMVGLLGLLEAVNVGMRQNSGTKLRNDAIMLADQVMAKQRVRPFADISTTAGRSQSVNAGAGSVSYTVNKTVTGYGGTTISKNVEVDVSWLERGHQKLHSLSTVITNENSN
jgi:type IV pilus assembly protein PilV